MPRWRSERGQASVELMGMLWWLFLCALVVWQIMLAAWAADQAGNAARTASRVAGRGGDGDKAAKNALTAGLRPHAKIDGSGETWTVRVNIPILIPGLDIDGGPTATRRATLPSTSGISF
jgi:Flp pilus assembly protein TadG